MPIEATAAWARSHAVVTAPMTAMRPSHSRVRPPASASAASAPHTHDCRRGWQIVAACPSSGSRTRMSHCSRVFRRAGSRDRASPPPLTPPTIDQACRNHQAGRALGYRSVTSGDGTRLRAWDNDGHGVPVLISNGLGTPHDAWPDINRRTDTYRVMTWDHRRLGGSQRPSDESRINISDHTDDLFAVMDA